MDNLVDQAVEQVAKKMIRKECEAFKDMVNKITNTNGFNDLSDENQNLLLKLAGEIETNIKARCMKEAEQKVLQSIIKNVEV